MQSPAPTGFHVITPVFEGPVDLLLHLVSNHERDILDIPLAPIVEAFVAEVERITGTTKHVDMDRLSEFLLVAAILLQIKSTRLLPGPDEIEDDDETVGWEERDLLLARLLECRAYAHAADTFVTLFENAARSCAREAGFDEEFVPTAPDLLEGVTSERLAQAYLKATADRPLPRVDLSHVTVDTLTVAETVRALVVQLPTVRHTSFRDLTAGLETRMEVIVYLLALLELCKLGKVSLGQGETFGGVEVQWIEGDLPVRIGARDDDGTQGDEETFEIDDYEG